MCGIVGIFGDIGFSEKRIAKTMHILDIVRGPDASGIVRITPDFSTSYIKEVGTPEKLIELDDRLSTDPDTNHEPFFNYKSGVVAGDTLGIIMHNRKATVGGLSAKAAHPFDFPHVIGVHNGTIQQHVYSKMEHYLPSVNDTEALYFEIDKYGVEEVYSKYSGAFACVAWNKATNQLMIWRNDQRPLFVMFRKDNGAVAWASEKWMLEVATSIERHSIDKWTGECLEVTKDKLFKLTYQEGKVRQSMTDLKPPSYVTGNFQGQTYTIGYGYGTQSKTTPAVVPQKEKPVSTMSAVPPANKTTGIQYGPDHLVDETEFYWWDNRDEKFHLNSDYHKTMGHLSGYIYRKVNNGVLVHRYYKPLKPSNKGNLRTIAKFANGIVGSRDPEDWLEVIVHADGSAVFFPPEKNNTPIGLDDNLSRYVVERGGKLWLTNNYVLPGAKKEAKKEFRGPFGVKYSLAEYEELLSETDGCSMCNHFPHVEEYHWIRWFDDTSAPKFVCTDCQRGIEEEHDALCYIH